ncbi:diphthamide synthesis protein [Candidatus Woesearchaeota archaeon]|nr:diphthamide synthesis protein [Candidatus Woesearchaeota archaeon]
MKTVFIHAKYKGKIELEKIQAGMLPKKIGLVATIQFLERMEEIKTYLESKGKEVFIGKGKQEPGQILGCDTGAAEEIQDQVEAFLYIGSGSFHPLGVAISTGKNVFCFNPSTSQFSKLGKEEIERYKKRKKAKYIKFLHADNIGILVSLKPGQCSYKKAEGIKKNLESKGKKCFIFVFDTLNAGEMENFPFVDFWINTACPRIANDKDKSNVIDMGDLRLED